MKDQFQTKGNNGAPSIKDVDGKKGIVTGYFSAFDNEDSDRDVIRKGAFAKSIRENGPESGKPRIKHLLNHDTSKPLGKILELREDNVGLYYESQTGSHSLGQDFVKMVESGLISEHSIGFGIVKRNQVGSYDKPGPLWELTELKLWEGSSLTSWGANMLTPLLGMKNEQKASFAANRALLLTKALRDGTFTDETFELLEIELKQLESLFIDLSKTTQPEEATEPEKKEDLITTLFTLKKAQ